MRFFFACFGCIVSLGAFAEEDFFADDFSLPSSVLVGTQTDFEQTITYSASLDYGMPSGHRLGMFGDKTFTEFEDAEVETESFGLSFSNNPLDVVNTGFSFSQTGDADNVEVRNLSGQFAYNTENNWRLITSPSLRAIEIHTPNLSIKQIELNSIGWLIGAEYTGFDSFSFAGSYTGYTYSRDLDAISAVPAALLRIEKARIYGTHFSTSSINTTLGYFGDLGSVDIVWQTDLSAIDEERFYFSSVTYTFNMFASTYAGVSAGMQTSSNSADTLFNGGVSISLSW